VTTLLRTTPLSSSRLQMLFSRLLPESDSARRLLPMVFLQAMGFGAITTISVVYGSRFLGFSNAQVGVGLSVAFTLGLAMGVPFGHLADRRGPRGLLMVLLAAEAISLAGYLFVSSWWSFLCAITAYQLFDRAANAVRGAMVAKMLPASEQATVRSYFRAVGNIGSAIGALGVGVALHLDTQMAYKVVVLACALGYGLAALSLSIIGAVPPVPVALRAAFGTALRDRRYMAFAALNMVLTLHYAVLEVAMPLWIIQQTQAPRYLVTALFLINTLFVICLQVQVGKRIDGVDSAQRATLISGLVFFGACLCFGLSASATATVAVLLLITAGVLHVLGEMAQSAGAFTLAYELSPPNAHGQYQGLFSTSSSAGLMLGSSVIGLIVLDHGLAGWLTVGTVFAIAGFSARLLSASPRLGASG